MRNEAKIRDAIRVPNVAVGMASVYQSLAIVAARAESPEREVVQLDAYRGKAIGEDALEKIVGTSLDNGAGNAAIDC